MQNAILYQAYGGTDYTNECRYSLLKYLQVYNLTPPADTAIVIYTDTPDVFSDFTPFFHHLRTLPLTKETAQRWRGANNFVHRLKIEMLIDFLHRFEGNLLYCDTDTYLTAAIHPLFNELEAGSFYMHQYEGTIDKGQNPAFHKWERFLSTTPVAYNNQQVQFDKSLQMYNAGVVGLNSRQKGLLQDVLALTDAVYAKFPKHIAEQFAFSYCLQKSGTLKTADHLVAHYWNLKEFRQLLKLFFTLNAEESIPNLIKKLHAMDAMAIQQEKNTYEDLPFLQRLFNTIRGKGWKIAQYEKRL
ncbi:MAG TPA: hypothetical protein VGN63_12910 [Flavisolibacter sp.]|jgi:hypothetical protein|nr:hypothetical protein [Flavisolibacter sp.]